MAASGSPYIVQFGAGNIGRSLAGQLFSRAGYRVVFIDAFAPVVDALNSKGEYRVIIKDEIPAGEPDFIEVKNVSGIMANDMEAVAEAVAGADIIGTAVGANVLPKICGNLAEGLKRRKTPVSILLCENLINAATHMRKWLGEYLGEDYDYAGRLGLVETSIGKMVPIMPLEVRERDPLEVWAERYNQIVADGEAFVGTAPEVCGLLLKKNFAQYVRRKLFIHNLGHATSAYHGFLAGKTYIWECMEDKSIQDKARAVMWDSANALIKACPEEFYRANQEEHIEDLLKRFHNKALGDSVFRVGRDLYRKLSPGDRCVGAVRFFEEMEMPVENVLETIAAALRFKATDPEGNMFADDVRFQNELTEKGLSRTLQNVCGFDAEKDAAYIDKIDSLLSVGK